MLSHRAWAALLASSLLAAASSTCAQPAQDTAIASAAAGQTPAPAAMTPAPTPPAHLRLREGTEVHVTLDEALSSATSAEGDEFSITTSEPINLGGGAVVPAGFRGRGEVSAVEKKGMMGKAGELSVRLDYVRIGDTKVELRSSQARTGQSKQSNAIVLSLLISPLFLLMHGKDVTIPKGQPIVAYISDDAEITLPATPPTQN